MYGKLTTGKPVKVISKTRRGRPVETSALDRFPAQQAGRSTPPRDLPGEAAPARASRSRWRPLQERRPLGRHVPQADRDREPAPDRALPRSGGTSSCTSATPRRSRPKPSTSNRTARRRTRPTDHDIKETTSRSLSGFLQEEFCRVSATLAGRIIDAADHGLTTKSYHTRTAREQAQYLHDAIQKTKISAPPSDCIAPIGQGSCSRAWRRRSPPTST
ncbi:MAG: hypothetical protein R3E96_05535 [Planctomycetota bacterium]